MIATCCLLLVGFQTKPNMLRNADFAKGLSDWKVEGAVRLEGKNLVFDKGAGSASQRYDVPGLRVLWYGANLKTSGRNPEADVRVRCYDAKNRLVMDVKGGPEDKQYGSVYLKTQAATTYVVLSVEKTSQTGRLEASEPLLIDDERDRVAHAPQVDLAAAMHPIWQGLRVEDESVLLLSAAGSPPAGKLIFKPDKILSVRDASLQQEFVEGKDFTVDANRIVANKGSLIPTMSDTEFVKGDLPWTELQGRHVFVTYEHSDPWRGPRILCQGDRLPGTISKLRAGKPLTIAAYGDSITHGINGSGFRNVPPYLPAWPSLFAWKLGKIFGDERIKLVNAALGGATSAWAEKNARDAVAALEPDLVLVAFGMNDFWSVSPADFRKNLEATMRTIRARSPKCEFILVTSIRFDPAYTTDKTYISNFDGYADEIRKMAGPGVAVLDMTAISKALYDAASAKDLLTDPMHPDDFLARWYAQGAVATMTSREP